MSKRPAASRLEFIPPQVATLVDQPPEGEGWIHEVKFDGYRTQIIVQGGTARIYTRDGSFKGRRQAAVCPDAGKPVEFSSTALCRR